MPAMTKRSMPASPRRRCRSVSWNALLLCFSTTISPARGAVEIDDVLPAWCGMPRIVVGARRLAKDDAGRFEGVRRLPTRTLVLPFDLDVAEMRLALGVGVEVMDAHEIPPTW